MVSPVMELLEVPAEVWDMAETYLRIYLLGMPVIGIYNFESAIFRSRGDTETPLVSLVFASLLNVLLDLLFVLYFGWGVEGVVWATVIANALAAAILFRALLGTDGVIRIHPRSMRMDPERLREIVRIGLPAGIQGMVFAISNIIIQSSINSLGPDAMAASAAAFTIEINVYCIMNGFGQATTTFVGQNYGAGDLARCRRVTWLAMGLNTVFMSVLAVFILLFSGELLSFFNGDPAVIALGKIRLFYIVAPEIVNVVLEGLSGAMRGYGMPQASFADEANIEDCAAALGMDSYEFRRKNIMPQVFHDAFSGNTNYYDSYRECMAKGAAYIDYERKKVSLSIRALLGEQRVAVDEEEVEEDGEIPEDVGI